MCGYDIAFLSSRGGGISWDGTPHSSKRKSASAGCELMDCFCMQRLAWIPSTPDSWLHPILHGCPPFDNLQTAVAVTVVVRLALSSTRGGIAVRVWRAVGIWCDWMPFLSMQRIFHVVINTWLPLWCWVLFWCRECMVFIIVIIWVVRDGTDAERQFCRDIQHGLWYTLSTLHNICTLDMETHWKSSRGDRKERREHQCWTWYSTKYKYCGPSRFEAFLLFVLDYHITSNSDGDGAGLWKTTYPNFRRGGL